MVLDSIAHFTTFQICLAISLLLICTILLQKSAFNPQRFHKLPGTAPQHTVTRDFDREIRFAEAFGNPGILSVQDGEGPKVCFRDPDYQSDTTSSSTDLLSPSAQDSFRSPAAGRGNADGGVDHASPVPGSGTQSSPSYALSGTGSPPQLQSRLRFLYTADDDRHVNTACHLAKCDGCTNCQSTGAIQLQAQSLDLQEIHEAINSVINARLD